MPSKSENLLDVVFRISDRFPLEIGDDGIVTVLEPQDHAIQRFFRGRLHAKIPEYKRITLDSYGSFVFRRIDGQTAVREIGEALRAQYGDQVEPLYDRLSLFLSQAESQCRYIEKVTP